MSSNQPFVRVNDLVVRFPVKTGQGTRYITPVDKVNFSVNTGEVLALVGESGSGKSTLGRALVRFNEPSSGSIHVDGSDVTHVRTMRGLRHLRQQVQMVFQDPFGSLNPVRSIGQHLSALVRKHQSLRGEALEQATLRLLETVGLRPAAEVMMKYPHELSGGQRQRVAIARALAVNPRFIVADEPISMLDVSIRADILELLNKLKDKFGLGYVYITHDLASAKYFGDRIMVLYAGQVMETGMSEEIIGDPAHPYTKLLLSSTAGTWSKHDKIELAVESPNLFEERRGCPFANRCPISTDICRTERPLLERGAADKVHAVACHHVNVV